jgi:hypothetical protein
LKRRLFIASTALVGLGDGASPKLMSDVFVTSENLLTIMDRIAGLYSNLKT